ncbi:hypothetical protein O1611_g4846 [Lasiodiplodia mahajangana]|uniref:Uncharacterized protein n=1 Tax=Lasiodiplodia mahajangana TaxID=1108764 RepID=A0ACC2JNG9_9PEZI|nr:hypothetical protein O1611_g4846 [Lasiodiplodia mahajangana]
MKFSTLFTALTAAFLAQAGVVERSGTKLTQAEAASRLSAGGVGWTSSGGCSDKTNPTCTSFDGVYSGTVSGAITLKGACGCTVTITGGTETGHASGTYSHANGYKFDFAKNTALNSYITNSFTRIGNRADGYPQWQAASGNIYCDEGNHWDVTYY